MECTDIYINLDNRQHDGGIEKGKRKAGKPDQGKPAALIVYLLLGLSILLSLILLILGVTLITRMSEEMRSSHTNLVTMLSQLNKSQPHPQCFCNWRTFNQKCYYFSTNKIDWSSAQEICSAKMSTLVVINSVEEQTFLKEQINSPHWIGVRDLATEGNWRWVDGTNYSSTVNCGSVVALSSLSQRFKPHSKE
ncbi:C-type lectin domain family 2 member B-like isoform X2 [Heptranchias perlo]|uniref:C-type lectin domain family 2 member B-like isoform X2 n=1 Tax=Heptranchias perlo TaxID=212740 RepID=UPI00355A1256